MDFENGKTPSTKAYLTIIEQLRRGIETGKYRRGEKLPTEKELCDMFDTSRSSVREALSALEYIGLIDVRGGSGYYVSGNNTLQTEELGQRCFAKTIAAIDPNWTIRTIKTLFEHGIDGAVLPLTDIMDGMQTKQLRAVRQASIDANIPVAILGQFSAADPDGALAFAEFAVRSKLDGVLLTSVRDANEVLNIRRVFDTFEADILIISEVVVDDPQVEDFLKVSDGIVIKGEFPAADETAATAAGEVISRANASGKLVGAAMRLQETMLAGQSGNDPVSRAIVSGCDGLYIELTGPAQKFPLDVVAKVRTLIKDAEERRWNRVERKHGRTIASPLADALCSVAAHAAEAMKAMAFIVPTETGFTPRLLAKFRQKAVIVAVSPHPNIVRQLRLVWGVQPLVSRRTLRQEDVIQLAVDTALQANYLREGDALVGVVGNMDVPNTYNEIKLITVGDIILKGQGIGSGIVSGRVTIIKNLFDVNKRVRNKIVVIAATEAPHVKLIEEAAALIVEEGGLSSHAAITCLSLGKPVIVGATDATELLLEDEQITVDVLRGMVYRGWVNLG